LFFVVGIKAYFILGNPVGNMSISGSGYEVWPTCLTTTDVHIEFRGKNKALYP